MFKIKGGVQVSDIAAHELGHILSKEIGNIGIEITKRAYYNLYKRNISTDEAIVFLIRNVSKYSTNVNYGKYNEVISEVLAKNNSQADDFTREFVRLLKDGV